MFNDTNNKLLLCILTIVVCYLFVVPKYGMYTYLGGRDFSLHGICSKKGIVKKY